MTLKSLSTAGSAVASGAEDAANAVLGSGADVAAFAGRQARTVGSGVEDIVREHPIASVGGALALGALVGVLARRRILG